MANIANGLLIELGVVEEQLFTQADAIENEALVFYSDDNEITLTCVYDEAREQVERIFLNTQSTEYAKAAMYSVAVLSTFR